MISKDEFIRRAARIGPVNEPGWADSVDANWEMAVQAASILNSRMPGVGFLSIRKRLSCFLAVCSQIDSLTESHHLTFEAALLAQHILLVTNSDYAKAHALFMHRAPSMSWEEAITFPKMALEWFKAARGQ